MSDLVTFPILNVETLARVRAAASQDPTGHDPRFATDYAMKGGQIVGALSICSIPVSCIWSHSTLNGPRDTMQLINIARSLAHRAAPGKPVLTMCSPRSPIFPFMERFHFVRVGETVLFEEEK